MPSLAKGLQSIEVHYLGMDMGIEYRMHADQKPGLK